MKGQITMAPHLGRALRAEKRIAELEHDIDQYRKIDKDMLKRIAALEATIKQVSAEIPSGPHYHHPDCNYWRWDWRYSWDDSDCNCDKVAGPEEAPAPDDEPTTKSESISSQLVDDELARLEREIAEGYAIAGIKEYSFNGWYQLKPTDSEWWNKKIEYLELRGLLERHPTDPKLVRLREKDDG